MTDIQMTPAETAAYMAGIRAWREAFGNMHIDAPEFPSNPYGDEWRNPPARAFREGFDEAARRDGMTYSRVDGEYHYGGEHETDEFPERGDV